MSQKILQNIYTNVLDWAKANENVLAVVITGSYATGKVDNFSDYDIELIVRNPEILMNTDEWIHSFGKVWLIQSFAENQQHPTRLVFYENAAKVDFTLANENRIHDMIEHGLDNLYQQGYAIALDKTEIIQQLPKAEGKAKRKNLPSRKEFITTVEEFWFEAAHMPKYLTRDELWVVKFRDWTMKEQMLKMLEWYALSKDRNIDVKYIGSGMKKWLPEDMWQEVHHIFSHFDTKDSWDGLIASIKLFRRLSEAVAEEFKFEYPTELDNNFSRYIQNCRPS
jgi:aminoglycoside 6-adenylyltransferase